MKTNETSKERNVIGHEDMTPKDYNNIEPGDHIICFNHTQGTVQFNHFPYVIILGGEKIHYQNIKVITKDLSNTKDIKVNTNNIEFLHKANKKQFQKFDRDLFLRYIDKFSTEDKVRMLQTLASDLMVIHLIDESLRS